MLLRTFKTTKAPETDIKTDSLCWEMWMGWDGMGWGGLLILNHASISAQLWVRLELFKP